MPARASSKATRKAKAPVRKAKKAAKPRVAAQRTRRKAVTISVGDEVTCAGANRLRRYRPLSDAGGTPARESVSGIVCSIRDIRTGETVKVATGDMDQYVFEVLDTETFAPGVSSPANSDTPAARQRVQALLERLRQGKQMPTMAAATLPQGALDPLDGWRIVKLHGAEISPAGPAVAAAKPAKRKKR